MNRLLFVVSLLLTITSLAWSRPTTHQAASSVIGQPDFTSDASTEPATAHSLDDPAHIAIDPTTGMLFVADQGNNRVLRYATEAAYQTHSAAEAVFGQSDFMSRDAADPPTASSFNAPAAVFVDAEGRLWVSDTDNSRVLRFDEASIKPSGADADAVIGQTNFTSRDSPGPGSHSDFESPVGLVVDDEGRLWVADFGLDRILRFDNAAEVEGRARADGVLGQPNFGTFDSDTSETAFNDPWGLWVDEAGRLWVADYGNSRVLRFDDAALKENGGSADGVLGQEDFDSTDRGLAADRFEGPYFLTIAPDGTLWVDDFANSRVLGFLDGASKADGADADIVLGQPDFTTDLDEGPNAQSITSPYGLATGRNGSLFVNDYSSNRVMVFEEFAVVASPVVSPGNAVLKAVFDKKIKKLKKKLKQAKKSGKTARVKNLKSKIKKFKKKRSAL